MSFEFKYEVNLNQINALQGHLRAIVKNASTGVPEAVNSFLNDVRDVAEERTHKISTTLSKGWRVKRQLNRFFLVNETPYAMREFGREGIKSRQVGRPPFGTPHNILPPIIDMVEANIEKVATDALFQGIPR